MRQRPSTERSERIGSYFEDTGNEYTPPELRRVGHPPGSRDEPPSEILKRIARSEQHSCSFGASSAGDPALLGRVRKQPLMRPEVG